MRNAASFASGRLFHVVFTFSTSVAIRVAQNVSIQTEYSRATSLQFLQFTVQGYFNSCWAEESNVIYLCT